LAACDLPPRDTIWFEIWHTDASGDYSAFADGGGGKDEAEGTTFRRGSQIADEQGIAEFLTIYPGCMGAAPCTSTSASTSTRRRPSATPAGSMADHSGRMAEEEFGDEH
jgi:protocatechuate 3,4-dioxygenase beta subunit